MNAYIALLRPHQWLKNLLLLFPPFLAGSLFQQNHWSIALMAFASFCLVSSATYIVNDARDRDADRQHPRKSRRPLASGEISVGAAISVALGFLIAAGTLALCLPGMFVVWLLAYLGLTLAYTFCFKDHPIFDVFAIASVFVFRLFAGGAAFAVEVSDWLFLSVLLLALFLSCGKRLAEKQLLGSNSVGHRKALDGYPPGVLEGLMYMSGASVLVTYTLYVIAKHQLVYSVPLCCFGLFRYVLLIKRGGSGDPTDSLTGDPVLFLVSLVWMLMVGAVVYF